MSPRKFLLNKGVEPDECGTSEKILEGKIDILEVQSSSSSMARTSEALDMRSSFAMKEILKDLEWKTKVNMQNFENSVSEQFKTVHEKLETLDNELKNEKQNRALESEKLRHGQNIISVQITGIRDAFTEQLNYLNQCVTANILPQKPIPVSPSTSTGHLEGNMDVTPPPTPGDGNSSSDKAQPPFGNVSRINNVENTQQRKRGSKKQEAGGKTRQYKAERVICPQCGHEYSKNYMKTHMRAYCSKKPL